MKRQAKWFLIPCAAMALTMGSALVSFAATGWAEENGEWVYYNNDGSKATDVFKKSGNNWFYLDSDGNMAKNQLIEDDDNYRRDITLTWKPVKGICQLSRCNGH